MKRTKRMKLPNGFGQISLIKGNLRKPYRVMVTIGHTPEGRPICKLLKPVSYFSTYNDAYYALIEYHKDPYDRMKDTSLKNLYEEWSERHFESISNSTQRQYAMAFERLQILSEMEVKNIKPLHIRKALDGIKGTYKEKAKILLNLLFDYALENEIIDKNYARITKIRIENDTMHHISFTDDEIRALWSDSSDFWTRYVLIQCYTGMRPGELVELQVENIHLDENYLIGGKKTKAGTDRRIPIHPSIQPLIRRQLNILGNFPTGNFFRNESGKPLQMERYRIQFKNIIRKLGLNPEHKAHDPRKFFITQAKKYQLDEYAIKLIVGHSINDLTESVYTERSNDWLYSEICKIVV